MEGGGGWNPGVRGQKVGENFQKSGSFLVKCEVISVVWGGRQNVGTPLSPPPPHQIVRVEHGGGPAGVGIFQVVKAGVGSDF